MVKKIFPVAVLAISLLVSGLYFAEANLVQNSSFEEELGGSPVTWDTWAWEPSSDVTEYKLETGAGHTGKSFVTIFSKTENDARYRQAVAVKGNTYYKLSGWIKTENVGQEKTGACLSIDNSVYTSPDLRGTNSEWQYVELNLQTGRDISSITITIGLGAYGNTNTGKASFDDIKLEELSQAPAGTVAPIGQPSPAGAAKQSGGRSPWLLVLVAVVVAAAGYCGYRYFKPKGAATAGETPKAGDLVDK